MKIALLLALTLILFFVVVCISAYFLTKNQGYLKLALTVLKALAFVLLIGGGVMIMRRLIAL